MRILIACVQIVWEWLSEPFREDPMDVEIGLEDMHELAGGRLEEPHENNSTEWKAARRAALDAAAAAAKSAGTRIIQP